MAIFGSFEEMTPAEVLTVVGKSTGTILTRCRDLGAVDIHVCNGLVVGLDREGRPATDALELHGVITDLLRRREGTFEFRRRAVDERISGRPPTFEAPLAQLVVNGLSYMEEIRAFQDALPSPKTIFEFLREPVIWLGDQLQSFYERAEGSLRGGANAEDLATLARVPVEQACWFLYKLRLAGVIQPRRSLASPAAVARPAPETARTVTPAPAGADADLRHVRVARPQGSFLNRLITGIAKLLPPSLTP